MDDAVGGEVADCSTSDLLATAGEKRDDKRMKKTSLEERLIRSLEEAGHRVTEPRTQLIRAVAAQNERPFTGEALYEELKSAGLGRATVFRTLKLLQDIGVLSRLHLPEGCQHYVVSPPDRAHDSHHDRIICRECGRVVYLDQCPMGEVISKIARESGYRVETHHLDFLGTCSECLDNESE